MIWCRRNINNYVSPESLSNEQTLDLLALYQLYPLKTIQRKFILT